MTRPAWDFMVNEDVYQLLEEYYGQEMSLQKVVGNSDRASIIRLLDDIVEDYDSGYGDEAMAARAKAAKRKL